MTWTRRDFAMVLFGLCTGLWGSTWLALLHPLAPFITSYPLGFWSLWIVADLNMRK